MYAFKLDQDFIDSYKTKNPNFGFNGLGELVYLRTYSRLKPDSTNEKWYETVKRVVEGTYNIQKDHIDSLSLGWDEKQAQESAKEMYTRMFEMKFLPPGRGLWSMGTDIINKKGLAASLNNCGFISTKDIGINGNLFSTPFTFLMDMSMLGVGVGFDTEGENNFEINIQSSKRIKFFEIEDTREGWVESVKVLLDSYNGGVPIVFDYSQIRAAGIPLKTFGGVSSGPQPLIDLHINLKKVLENNLNKNITITTIVDIMNLIGKCVVSGNIRRCLPRGTIVHTVDGLIPIEQISPGTGVYTSQGIAETVDYVYQGLQQLLTITTELGEFKCTPMHKIAIADYENKKKYTWTNANKLTTNDKVVFIKNIVKGTNTTIAFDDFIIPLCDSLAKIIGYLNGKGYYGLRYPSLRDKEIIEYPPEILCEYNKLSLNNKIFIDNFVKNDIFTVPTYILQGSAFTRSEYLSGVLISMNNFITSDQFLFVKHLQCIYASLGIPCNLNKIERSLTNNIKSVKYTLNKIDNLHGVGNIIPIRVINIHSDPNDVEQTYDISVKDVPEFIAAEGLLVHNTAEIAFGKMDSDEFMDLKDYSINPQRMDYGWTSNNSIYAKLGMDYTNVSKRILINGEPGLAWLENMRAYSRMVDKPDNKDYRVMGGNPCLEQSLESYELCCVTGDTRIQTKKGCPKIKDVVGVPVEVWNGQEWSEVKPFLASKNKLIYRVEISDGSYLDCTEDHKWCINNTEVETKFLKLGDKLPTFVLGDISGIIILNIDIDFLLSEKIIPESVFTFNYECTAYYIDKYIKKYGIFNNDLKVNIYDYDYENLIKLQLLLRRVKINNVTITHFMNSYLLSFNNQLDNETIPQTVSKISILPDKQDVYCFNEPINHKGVFGNVLTYQCLVETFPNKAENLDDYLRTLKFAYLYAKTVTLGLTHWPETNRVQLRNRRIGCSVSGIAQFLSKYNIHTLNKWLDTGYSVLKKWDIVYSEWLCIPRSIKMTSIKPSGTVSLLAGATPGMHYPESRFYIRRMRLAANSPLVDGLKSSGYHIEPAVGSENDTLVVEIPVDVGEGIRTVNDVSIWEQVALAANMQRWWADNQVSCTVTFNPKTEGNQIASVLDYFQYQLKGISFLPKCDYGAFPQMPYEEITEEKYIELLKNIKTLNFSTNNMSQDGEGEMYCDSTSCIRI